MRGRDDTHQWRAGVIRYLGGRGRRGFRVDVIIITSGCRRHVAGGVRRHVAAAAAAFVSGRSTAVRMVIVFRHRRGRFPHASDGRVSAAGAGHRTDAHQNVGVGHVRGARVTGTETERKRNGFFYLLLRKKQRNAS